MNNLLDHPPRKWSAKFRDAFRGVYYSVRGERSFHVHFLFAAAAIIGGFVFHVSLEKWSLIAICIAGVMAAETFNSAIEQLSRAVSREQNPHIGAALDMASGAVLLTAAGSVVVGFCIFLPELLKLAAQL